MGIVEVSLLLIAKDLVCLGDFLEPGLGNLSLLFGNFVRVVLESGLVRRRSVFV